MVRQFNYYRFVLAPLLAASVLTGCRDSPTTGNSNRVPTANPQPANPPGVAAPPEDLTSSGPIVVENQLDVSAQREGIVSKISADTGRFVHKGDLLAQLDGRQLTADRDAAEAKLRSIDANVKNWQSETKVLEADLARSEKMWDAQI